MTVGKRLAEERKKRGYASQKSLADAISVNFTTISRWETDEGPIPSDKLLLIEKLGLDMVYILTGKRTIHDSPIDKIIEFERMHSGIPSKDDITEMAGTSVGIDVNNAPGYADAKLPTVGGSKKTESNKNNELSKTPPRKSADTSALLDENFAMIPLYNIKVSAGNGRFADSGNIKRYEPFSRAELIRRGYNKDLLACVQVHGDSMTPALSEGDVIMIDMSQRDPLGAIYVLRAGDAYYVKRLVRELDQLLVISDNKTLYPIWTLKKGDDFEVIGKAVWFGRYL